MEIGRQLPERMISLVDVLFGIGVGINFETLMERPWFVNPTKIACKPYLFEVLVVCLVYCWALSSWWSYHESIRRKPIKSGRFFVDIITMFVYFLIFVSYESLKTEIILFTVAFVSYIVWDLLKAKESGNPYGSKRDCATLLWAAFFTLLLLSNGLAPRMEWLDWVFLLFAYVGTIGYRIHKWYLTIKEPK